MNFFERIEGMESSFLDFSSKISKICDELKIYDFRELGSIEKIKKSFDDTTKDFMREDRKLNVGIIGQIKTGRSTFLNTLLFDGENVLPKAVTPKTATVTKILYGSENHIEIEYYTDKEWKAILKKAEQKNVPDNAAKEILDSVNKHGLDPSFYINKEKESIYKKNYDDLKEILNDYIGENGRYTPFVKDITLYIKRAGIKHLCIIDTPGINDPISSRSSQTKDFLEKCDVVFFLSRSGQFLDKNDVSLLTGTIPENGVKKLILICSRYDDGLNDMLMNFEDFDTANEETKKSLIRHSNKVFTSIINSYREKGAPREVIDMFRKISLPVFISSMANNMSKKFVEDFDDDEMVVFKNLNYFKNINREILFELGNFKEVEKLFKNVSRQKENSLLRRCNSFVPDAKDKIINELERIKFTLTKRINLLSSKDKRSLESQRDSMLNQMENISESIDTVFDELYFYIDEEKEFAMLNLEDELSNAQQIEEEIKKDFIVEKELISKSKWYNPLSWGEKEEKEVVIEDEYSSINVKSALDKIRNYAINYENEVDNSLHSAIKTDNLKTKLLISVMENNDRFSEGYDPLYFNALVRKSLDSISMPEIKIDVNPFLDIITEKYSGQLKSASDKNGLKALLSSCVKSIYNSSNKIFFDEVEGLKGSLASLKNNFYKELYKNVTEEYNILIDNYENSEKEINKYNLLIEKIDFCIKELL